MVTGQYYTSNKMRSKETSYKIRTRNLRTYMGFFRSRAEFRVKNEGKNQNLVTFWFLGMIVAAGLEKRKGKGERKG